MEIRDRGVVITGGSSGIGFALARALVESGAQVLVCGRRSEKLAEAKVLLPQIETVRCDVASPADRARLLRVANERLSTVDILVNNAGVQRETDFRSGASTLTDGESEIEINLTAAVQLTALFVPHLLKQDRETAVVQVSSGLAFVPLKILPVYCATKAALHSFSMSLRAQLAETNVRVFELIPPLVRTDLHREEHAKAQAERGIEPERVATKFLRALDRDKYEVAVGQARDLRFASRVAPHFFQRLLDRVASG